MSEPDEVEEEAATMAADVVDEAADAATEGANADEEFPYGKAPNVEHPA